MADAGWSGILDYVYSTILSNHSWKNFCRSRFIKSGQAAECRRGRSCSWGVCRRRCCGFIQKSTRSGGAESLWSALWIRGAGVEVTVRFVKAVVQYGSNKIQQWHHSKKWWHMTHGRCGLAEFPKCTLEQNIIEDCRTVDVRKGRSEAYKNAFFTGVMHICSVAVLCEYGLRWCIQMFEDVEWLNSDLSIVRYEFVRGFCAEIRLWDRRLLVLRIPIIDLGAEMFHLFDKYYVVFFRNPIQLIGISSKWMMKHHPATSMD